MTSFLLSAVVVLTVLVALNLLLTFGVIQRLRSQAQPHATIRAFPTRTLPVGTPMPEVTFTAVDGTAVDFAATDERTLIAFVSSGCSPCHEQLPALRSIVTSAVEHGERAIVVALTHAEGAPEFVEAFAGLAPVILQTEREEVSEHFAVDGYPTYVTFAQGVLERGYAAIEDMQAPARA